MLNIEEKHLYWNGHLEAFTASGLSRRTYCKNNNLPLSTFAYWKRRLTGNGNAEICDFVEVPVPKDLPAAAGTTGEPDIIIRLRDGIEVMVAPCTKMDFLLCIIGALEKRL
jgi:hypothetical protein